MGNCIPGHGDQTEIKRNSFDSIKKLPIFDGVSKNTFNQKLISFIQGHDTSAYENDKGSVTMEIRFFNAVSEYVEVTTFNEARIQLNY